VQATGGIAHAFARDLIVHGHRAVAVGSRSRENARDFAQFDVPNAHGTYPGREPRSYPTVTTVHTSTTRVRDPLSARRFARFPRQEARTDHAAGVRISSHRAARERPLRACQQAVLVSSGPPRHSRCQAHARATQR
jgi:hypothetical protein